MVAAPPQGGVQIYSKRLNISRSTVTRGHTRGDIRPPQLLVAGTRNGAGNGVSIEEYPPGKVRRRPAYAGLMHSSQLPEATRRGGTCVTASGCGGTYPENTPWVWVKKGAAGAKRFIVVLCLLLTLILAHSALLCGQATGLSAGCKDLMPAVREQSDARLRENTPCGKPQ
eukprot:COSAG01_NODE_327_length_18766_cov_84.941983_10_plen_170_part_00